ncbi:MAG TPA: biotin--[acetyl-CoA-carboxylase] ligase [Candidatus Tumulicola sp.]|nr:biotin--[acetyl-CoA-carboxylase] ligase [Candidatus Tumulicola sp.]
MTRSESEDRLLPIDAAALAAAVAHLVRFRKVQCQAELDSTNSSALRAMRSRGSAGLTILAEEQRAGRGRAGRPWTSPVGSGLLLSTILPTPLSQQTLPALGFWAALAAAQTIERLTGFRPDFKWPNDLVTSDGKLAGILVEGETIGAASRMVIGVGINVNRPAAVPSALAGTAAWLSDVAGHRIDRTVLAAGLLQCYEREYDRLLERPKGIIADWARGAKLEGLRLSVRAAGGALLHEGIARGVADDGALLLDTTSGPVRVTLGDVAML